MSKIPIIAFANTRWNSLWMNRQHLLSRLALLGRPVAYSNGTVHYNSFFVPFRQRAIAKDNVTVMTQGYCLPHSYRPSALRKSALEYHCQRILDALGLEQGQDIIGMCFDVDFLDFIDVLQPKYRIFHIYDSFNLIGPEPQEFDTIRRRIKQFDLVTASSAYMYVDVLGERPDDKCIIPNGVDFERICRGDAVESATAQAIRRISGAKIGYVGSINSRIDFDLVHGLATTLPDKQFIFVGPVRYALLLRNPSEFRAYERIRTLSNVHFFAEVPKEELAAVLSAMDINCIFFRTDRGDWISSVYPIKINEYLASGRPVITADIRIAMDQFADVTRVCSSFSQWVRAIVETLGEGVDIQACEARRRVAKSNDWSQHVNQLESLITAMTCRDAGQRG